MRFYNAAVLLGAEGREKTNVNEQQPENKCGANQCGCIYFKAS